MSRDKGYKSRKDLATPLTLNRRFDRMVDQLSTVGRVTTYAASASKPDRRRHRARSSSSGVSRSSYDGPRTPSDLHTAFDADTDDGRSSGRLGDEFAVMKMKASATVWARPKRARRGSAESFAVDVAIEDGQSDICGNEVMHVCAKSLFHWYGYADSLL
jgi:hypothetical protein